jgi:hypothetical protein
MIDLQLTGDLAKSLISDKIKGFKAIPMGLGEVRFIFTI